MDPDLVEEQPLLDQNGLDAIAEAVKILESFSPSEQLFDSSKYLFLYLLIALKTKILCPCFQLPLMQLQRIPTSIILSRLLKHPL